MGLCPGTASAARMLHVTVSQAAQFAITQPDCRLIAGVPTQDDALDAIELALVPEATKSDCIPDLVH